MVDFGYDISDFKDIDKIFGTLMDFENLVKRAKEIGLKVIKNLYKKAVYTRKCLF